METPCDRMSEDRRCVECGKPLTGFQIWYCCKKCKWRAKSRRRYQHNKRNMSESYLKNLQRRQVYAKEWRANNALSGNCVRCGEINDNAEHCLKVCSKCRMELAK